MARVTAVVCAGFDAASDAAIAGVRARVLAGDARLRAPANRPHLTLSAAVVDEGDELDQLIGVVGLVAERHAPLPLTLDRMGSFRRAGVIWLGPTASTASTALGDLQIDVATSLVEAGWPSAFGTQSDPQHWVPHCTIARKARKAAALGCEAVPTRVDRLVTILLGRGEFASVGLSAARR